MEIVLVLTLLLAAIVLFATEKFTVDVVTIMLLIILVATGILTPNEAFAGFGSDFIIILASIFVISGALRETGVLDRIGSRLVKTNGIGLPTALLYIMGITGTISAFMNNTTVTALLVGPVIGIARKMNVSQSKLLMPMAFSSILGGTCTLIGTSTNVAVSGFMEQVGLQPITMFEILPVGLILFVTGLAYMLLFGARFLPSYEDVSYTEGYALREYLSEVVVVENSPLIGQKILDTNLGKMDLRILKLIRENQPYFPHPFLIIEEGDMLLVEGKVDDLIRIKEIKGIEIKADTLETTPLQTEKAIQLAEVLITNTQSDLVGSTIKKSNFRQRFGLVVLAIYRHGQSLRDKIGNTELHLGDLLLVHGPPERLKVIRENRDLAILGEFTPVMYREKRGLFTVAVFLLAVIAGSMQWIPLSASFLAAALSTVVTKSLSPEKAYSVIDWRLLILIGGMSAFGTAMEKTGASEFLANHIINLLQDYGVVTIMAGFIALTIFLTQPMSNAAAALVILPVALETASRLDVNPRTFAIAIMLAASVSLITPFEPSCILVYGPGKYKFMDFLKNGSILTILLMILLVILVPMWWPL
jgi:di/tricarboxylate transporter